MQLGLTRRSNNCGDPLLAVPFGSQHYDIGHQACATRTWFRHLRSQVCRSRAQWDWLRSQS